MAKTAAEPDQDASPDTGRRTGLERSDVVAAALDLVRREGPAALTMRKLATDLDVTTPTIYWHVGSRDELVTEMITSQAERLAERAVEGDDAVARITSAATALWHAALDDRAITSLAHQTGTTSLLLHHLEVALLAEIEAAGLSGDAAADVARSILVAVSGALVLALRDPEAQHAAALWDGDDDRLAPETVAAMCAPHDVAALSAATIRAVVEHHVGAPAVARRRAAKRRAAAR